MLRKHLFTPARKRTWGEGFPFARCMGMKSCVSTWSCSLKVVYLCARVGGSFLFFFLAFLEAKGKKMKVNAQCKVKREFLGENNRWLE